MGPGQRKRGRGEYWRDCGSTLVGFHSGTWRRRRMEGNGYRVLHVFKEIRRILERFGRGRKERIIL